MRIASLSCFAIIVLSFLATRVEAQIDSNAEVTLYCPLCIGYYHNALITYCGDNPNGDTEGYSDPISGVEFDTSFRFSVNDSIHLVIGSGKGGANFFVDTISKCFRHVYFYGKNTSYPWDYACSNCIQFGYVSNNTVEFQMTNDSVPYRDSASSIVASGKFNFAAIFSASFQCRLQREDFCASDNYSDSENHYIHIVITPNHASIVSNIKKRPMHVTFVDGNSQYIACTLDNSKGSNRVDFIDFLGRFVKSIPLSNEEETIELPSNIFPPGLYFARLSDQVAKLIVPPR